jgi:ComF family protein
MRATTSLHKFILWIYKFFLYVFNNAKNFLFPDICIVCSNKTTNNILCKNCFDSLLENYLTRKKYSCPLCGQNKKFKQCGCEYAWDFSFEKIYSLFDFDETIKKIVHDFKYNGFKNLAFLTAKNFSFLIPDDLLKDIDIIIPVPLHFLKKLKRGYNQAEYLAKGIIFGKNIKDIPLCKNVLLRKKATKTQTALSKYNRSKNIISAFTIKKEKMDLIKDKNILLVDDIITTGSTCEECSKTLLNAGAKSVRVLSLARD